jgi:tetratricopeptide (TPR) repeat protein
MSAAIEDLLSQARVARREHRLDDARKHYENAVAVLRESNDPLRLAHTIRHLGDVHYDAGRPALAEPHLREALALYRSRPDAPLLDVANAIRSLAVFEEHAGDRQEGIRLWAEAHDLYVRLDVKAGVAESKARLARGRSTVL